MTVLCVWPGVAPLESSGSATTKVDAHREDEVAHRRARNAEGVTLDNIVLADGRYEVQYWMRVTRRFLLMWAMVMMIRFSALMVGVFTLLRRPRFHSVMSRDTFSEKKKHSSVPVVLARH